MALDTSLFPQVDLLLSKKKKRSRAVFMRKHLPPSCNQDFADEEGARLSL